MEGNGKICAGTAKKPIQASIEWAADRTTTGICPVCKQRLNLDNYNRIPEHPAPDTPAATD